MSDSKMIVFRGVKKHYDEKYALNGLDLSIREGEFVTVVGGSGGGKTTMLKLINGLILPDEGSVRVYGEDTAHTDLIALRRKIGYVIQGGALFPHLNVRENIEYVPKLQKKKLEHEKLLALLDMVALDEELCERNVNELSGGQQQRVGIARALAAAPSLILMDEPFGAVDGITRKQLQDAISGIFKKTGTTIVFVTHDLREAVRLGTRLVIVNEGELVQDGEPDDVVAHPATQYVKQLSEQLDCV